MLNAEFWAELIKPTWLLHRISVLQMLCSGYVSSQPGKKMKFCSWVSMLHLYTDGHIRIIYRLQL